MSGFKTNLYQSAQLRQEMKINPRLYQAMELLYMPLLDLQMHLGQELTENPFLEQNDIADPVTGQVIGNTGTDDAATDNDDARTGGQIGRHD